MYCLRHIFLLPCITGQFNDTQAWWCETPQSTPWNNEGGKWTTPEGVNVTLDLPALVSGEAMVKFM